MNKGKANRLSREVVHLAQICSLGFVQGVSVPLKFPSGADMQLGFCARRICACEVIIQLKYLAS